MTPEPITDTQRIDFLDSLVGRHEMTPCWKGKDNPEGLRRDRAGTDAHVNDEVDIYIRDIMGYAVVSARGATWREAIDAVMAKMKDKE